MKVKNTRIHMFVNKPPNCVIINNKIFLIVYPNILTQCITKLIKRIHGSFKI